MDGLNPNNNTMKPGKMLAPSYTPSEQNQMRATAATSNMFKDRQFEMDQTLNDPYDGDPDLQRDADFTSTQYDPSPDRRVTINYNGSEKTRNHDSGTKETGAFQSVPPE